jgi:hypothetical protein
MNTPFTEKERRKLLNDYFRDQERAEELDYEVATTVGEASETVVQELDSLRSKISDALDLYRLNVPVLPLSRCPITRQVAYHSIDVYGLDGLWWDNQVPIRPVDVLPSTFIMVLGALKLGPSLEKAPFPVRPGPEAPYVVPEVLSNPNVKAVVSTVKVGVHTAYPIFYYGLDWEKDLEPMNNWGANHWSYLDRDGNLRYNEYGVIPISDDSYLEDLEEAPDDDEEDVEYTVDYDLRRWLEEGKLLWIAPGDQTFTLREGASGCPYLDLPGSRVFSLIVDGERLDDVDEED